MNRQDLEFDKFLPDGTIKVVDLGTFVKQAYDYIEIGYTGDDITSVKYRNGGVSGTIVCTLTLTYTSTKLTGVAIS